MKSLLGSRRILRSKLNKHIFFGFFAASMLLGCGSDSTTSESGSGSGAPDRELATQTQVSGSVTKGRMAFATVQFSRYEAGNWQLLAVAETDGNGNYQIDLAREQLQGVLLVSVSPRESGTTMMRCDWPAGCGAYSGGFINSLDTNGNGAVDFGEWRQMPPGFSLNALIAATEPAETLEANISVITHLTAKRAAQIGAAELSATGQAFLEEAALVQTLLAANSEVAEALGLRGSLTAINPVSPAQLMKDANLLANDLPSVDAILYGALNVAAVGVYGSFENFLNALSADRDDFAFALQAVQNQGQQNSTGILQIENLMAHGREVLRSLAQLPEALNVVVREAETLLLAEAGGEPADVVGDEVSEAENDNASNDDAGDEVGEVVEGEGDSTDQAGDSTQPPVADVPGADLPLNDVALAKAFLRQVREMGTLGEERLPVWEAQIESLSDELSVTAEIVEPELLAAVAALQEIIAVGQNKVEGLDLESSFEVIHDDLLFSSEGAVHALAAGNYRNDAENSTIQVQVTGTASNGVVVDLVLDVGTQVEQISAGAPEWHNSNEVSDRALATAVSGKLISGETNITLAQTFGAKGLVHQMNYRHLPRSQGVVVDAELQLNLGFTLTRTGTNPLDFTGRIMAEWVVDQYQFGRDYLSGTYQLMPWYHGLGEPAVAYLDTLYIEGAVVGSNLEQGVALSIAMTDVQAFYDAYENYYSGADSSYDYMEANFDFQGHINAQIGFQPEAEEWVSFSLAGGTEVVYEYLAYDYRSPLGNDVRQEESYTQRFVPEGITAGISLNGQTFSLEVVDQTEHSVDRFCGGDASLWQITNQDNVSLMFNISEQCNFGKIYLEGGTLKTLGTLEQRDNLWMIQFIDGTFETLF